MTSPGHPTRVFKFSLDEKGNFVYDPPTNWQYRHTDRIRFQTPTGPFTIAFHPVGGIVNPDFNPLSGPLSSVPAGDGTYVADTSVNDGLTDAERKAIMAAHVDAANPQGFITIYHYEIQVTDPHGKVHQENQKNGIYSC